MLLKNDSFLTDLTKIGSFNNFNKLDKSDFV